MDMVNIKGFEENVQSVIENMEYIPDPVSNPVMVVLVGLPGSGKSYFGNRLRERISIARVETDWIRKFIFRTPVYNAKENNILFKTCHMLLERLLTQGVDVLFDATNLVEANRERLYNISYKTDSRLILVKMEAPSDLIFQRLEQRRYHPDVQDNSDADWSIFRKMRSSFEPIRKDHFTVDTSKDIGLVIEKVVREIKKHRKS